MNDQKNIVDIYPHRKKTFQRELKKLEESNISTKNKEVITEFQNHLFAIGCSQLRVSKLSAQLRYLCRWMNKGLNIQQDLKNLTKNNIVSLVAFINQAENYSDATKADYRRIIKQFFRWYKDEDKRLYSDNKEERITAQKFYAYIDKDIRSSYKEAQADPATVITEKDCQEVIERGCRTPKEKALISMLYETGCRAAEFINIRIGDVIIKDSYGEIHVPDGKTGKRVVYVVHSVPFFLKYLDVHPYKENKNSLLWLGESLNRQFEVLKHKGTQKLINRCFERSGIEKKHNMHWFRHSRATLLAPKITEVMLCKFMGWTIGSRQVKTYLHLCNKQLEDVFLSVHGIKQQEADTEKPSKCVCGTLNAANERYCFRCFKPLSVVVAVQDEELKNSEINKTMQFFMEVAQDPQMMKAFQEFKKRLQEESP